MIQEIWKPIPGYPGYEASSHGRVRSFHRRRGRRDGRPGVDWYISDKPQRILQPGHDPRGYPSHGLRVDGLSVQRKAHALVALAFLGPRPDDLICCHNDSNPKNNHISNIRYDTYRANIQDGIAEGTFKGIADAEVVSARTMAKQGIPLAKIASIFEISHKHMRGIVTGRHRATAGGPISTLPSLSVKLSDTAVRSIRQERRDSGTSLSRLARKYKVDQSNISLYVRGKRRRDVGGPIEGKDYPPPRPGKAEAGKLGAAERIRRMVQTHG